MNHLHRSSDKNTMFQGKKPATQDRNPIPASRSNLAQNPELIWQKQTKLPQDLLSQCYEIIKEQQAYIEKLEKDNNRKDSIIANLLNKNACSGVKKCNHNLNYVVPPHLSEFQRLSNQMMDLYGKYQKVALQNQTYKTQLEHKQRQIHELQGLNKSLEEKQKLLDQEIEQAKLTVNKLKQAYEAKIAKLLTQIRRKIEEDVQKSMRKRTETEYSEENQKDIKPFVESSHHRQLANNLTSATAVSHFHTPSKISQKQKKLNKAQKENDVGNRAGSQQYRAMVTPQKISPNFISTSFKTFPNSGETECSLNRRQSDLNSIQMSQQKSARILAQVRDVEFITDSYDDSNIQSQQVVAPKEQNNNHKISINKIVSQHGYYLSKQEESGRHGAKDLNMETENQMDNKLAQMKKIRIVQFLEELNEKMKRYENEEPDYF